MKRRMLSTPGFISASTRAEIGPAEVIGYARRLWSSEQPTWIVGDRDLKAERLEDEGRTLRVPANLRFYAIRDDHEPDCSCGCGGSSVVTFLLPEEY